MSIKSVRSEIRQAMRTDVGEKTITTRDARRIVAEAAKGPVTPGEVKALQELVSKGVDPQTTATLATPELSNDQFYLTTGGARVLSDFIDRNTKPREGPTMHTLMVPENPQAPVTPLPPGMNLTLAYPESPGQAF